MTDANTLLEACAEGAYLGAETSIDQGLGLRGILTMTFLGCAAGIATADHHTPDPMPSPDTPEAGQGQELPEIGPDADGNYGALPNTAINTGFKR